MAMNKNQTFTITTQSTCIRLDRQKHPHKGPKKLVDFLDCLVSTLFFCGQHDPQKYGNNNSAAAFYIACWTP
jgi:hypothetical protein